MADRDSARRGSPDSLIGGRNRLSSGITGNTTTVADSAVIGVYFVNDPPISPDPDISVSPPEPVPAADFVEPQETGRVIKTQRTPAPIQSFGQTRFAAVGNAKAFVLSAPRPDYPYEARSRHITGSSVAVISVDPNSGLAVDAMMEQSIGNPILDNSTVSAFRRWRFKPGTPARVRIPITFVLTGAQCRNTEPVRPPLWRDD